MTTVELTDQQALLLLLLSKAKAWDMRSGSVEVHFDKDGRPVKAKTTQFTELSTPQENLPSLTIVL